MERVHQVLVVLEPVAGDDGGPAAAHAAVVGLEELARVERLEDLVARQHGLALGRAHVGEDQAVALLHRVPGLAHPLALRGRRRARRAARGSGPPRRRASRDSSSGCRAPPRGRSRAWCRDARSARCTRPGRPRRSRKSTRSSPSTRSALGVSVASPNQADGVPVAPQQLAHRRARAHQGQLAHEAGPGPAVARAGVSHGASLLPSPLASPGSAGGAGSLERRRSSVGTPAVSTLLSGVSRVMRVMWLIMSAIWRTARSPRSK